MDPLSSGAFSSTTGEKFKFEIKKATEVNQRLDDVKGIDEIRSEIQDLIKMIKSSTSYR